MVLCAYILEVPLIFIKKLAIILSWKKYKPFVWLGIPVLYKASYCSHWVLKQNSRGPKRLLQKLHRCFDYEYRTDCSVFALLQFFTLMDMKTWRYIHFICFNFLVYYHDWANKKYSNDHKVEMIYCLFERRYIYIYTYAYYNL